MDRVEVVVPWRGGCPHREAAWEWVSARYAERHPDWSVVRAPARSDGPWCKARAVIPMLATITAEIVIVADADVWCDGLDDAVEAVVAGAPWAIPHEFVHRLTIDATLNVLSGRPDNTVEQAPYRGIQGGGIVVAHRDSLHEVPLDPRFTGWGQEDESWGHALECLLGDPWLGTADLIHLWHPPPTRLTRRRGSQESWQLYRRYRAARHDPAAMRLLIEEAHHESRHPAQPDGHDHPPAALRHH